jgi:hypothetical protein
MFETAFVTDERHRLPGSRPQTNDMSAPSLDLCAQTLEDEDDAR